MKIDSLIGFGAMVGNAAARALLLTIAIAGAPGYAQLFRPDPPSREPAAEAISSMREALLACGETRSAFFPDSSPGRIGDKPVKSIHARWDDLALQSGDLAGKLRQKNVLANGAGPEFASASEYTFKVRVAALSSILEVRETVPGLGEYAVVATCSEPGCHRYGLGTLKLANPRNNRDTGPKSWGAETIAAKLDDWVADGAARAGTSNDIWLPICGGKPGAERLAKVFSQAIAASGSR